MTIHLYSHLVRDGERLKTQVILERRARRAINNDRVLNRFFRRILEDKVT